MIFGIFCDYEGHKKSNETTKIIADSFQILKQAGIVPKQIMQGLETTFEKNLKSYSMMHGIPNYGIPISLQSNLYYRAMQTRNHEIVSRCEIVLIILMEGHCRGTEHVVSLATLANKPVITINKSGKLIFENESVYKKFIETKYGKENSNGNLQ